MTTIANLGTIYRRTYTVDIAWSGDPKWDWAAKISDGVTDGEQVLLDVRAGALHECRENVAEQQP
jgi:hypothetical protein